MLDQPRLKPPSGGQEIHKAELTKLQKSLSLVGKNSKILEIDHKLNTIDFKTISLEEVGNMTYFIEVKSNDYSYKITWTDLTDNPGIKDLYKTLIRTFQNP